MLTLDANVFVSASAPAEAQYAVSLAFIGRVVAQSADVHCPSLVLPEIAAAIIRPTSNAALAAQTVSGIRLLPNITLVTLTEQRAEQAAQIAISCRLRGADAIYVAVAQEFGTTLITWDAEMLTRGAQAVTVMTPSDWLAANPTI